MEIVSGDEIVGKRVILRPITAQDTPLIVSWRNNERVRHSFIYRETFTEAIHEKWLAEQVATGHVRQFIICEKDPQGNMGRPVGSVYLRDVDMAEGSAEYGIFIGEDDAAGCGYGTEAAGLMVEYAVRGLGLKRLILRVYTDNIPAIKSYEAAGFKRIQTLEGVMATDGERRDMYLMELSDGRN